MFQSRAQMQTRPICVATASFVGLYNDRVCDRALEPTQFHKQVRRR
jgi:hypothetical protein